MTDDIRMFRCTKCGKKMVRNFTMNFWDKESIDREGNYWSICGQTGKIEKCMPIKK